MSANPLNPKEKLAPAETESIVGEITHYDDKKNDIVAPALEKRGLPLKSTGSVRCLLIGPTLFFDTVEDKLANDEIVFYRHYSLDALYFSLKPKFDLSILDSATYRQLAHPIYQNLRKYLMQGNIFVLGEQVKTLELWDDHKKNPDKLNLLESDAFSLNDLALLINKNRGQFF